MSLYVDCITFGLILGASISASYHMGILEICLSPEEGPPYFLVIPSTSRVPKRYYFFLKIPLQVQGLNFGRQGMRVLGSD